MTEAPSRPGSLEQITETLTAGSVLRSVWQLAAPNVATSVLTSLNGIMDRFFVGHLGKAELSALGQSQRIWMFLMVFTVAVTTGTTALISRFSGARERENAMLTAQQSLRLSLLMSLIVGVPLWLLRYQTLAWLGASSEVAQLGSVYLAIAFATTSALFLNMTLSAIFRGTGQMRVLMFALMAMDLLNIVLDIIFIYGFGMRLLGAALAAGISRTVPVVWLLLALRRSELAPALRGNWLQLSPEWSARILRIGSPQIIGSLAFNLGGTAVMFLLNKMPNADAAIAAFTFGIGFEALSFMPGFAFNIATATLVGQNLGARKPERAERCARIAMWLAAGIMGAVGLLLFIFARQIAALSGKDPEVRELCTLYLQIGAITQPFLGMSMVLWGALTGAGDTRFAAIVSLVSNFILRVPTIWFFGIALGYGATAVWWILTLTWLVAAAMLEWRFRLGKWKEIQV